jgi:hypothetical protein
VNFRSKAVGKILCRGSQIPAQKKVLNFLVAHDCEIKSNPDVPRQSIEHHDAVQTDHDNISRFLADT